MAGTDSMHISSSLWSRWVSSFQRGDAKIFESEPAPVDLLTHTPSELAVSEVSIHKIRQHLEANCSPVQSPVSVVFGFRVEPLCWHREVAKAVNCWPWSLGRNVRILFARGYLLPSS